MALSDHLSDFDDIEIKLHPIRSVNDAQTAYICIKAILSEEDEEQKHYALLCQKFPFLLRRHGLAKTLGWLYCKYEKTSKETHNETPEFWFLSHLFWCLQEELMEDISSSTDDPIYWAKLLVSAAQSGSLERYLMLTQRCLELSEWFRHYAQSELSIYTE
jgi:CRISPR type III-B/RAMP module-associated protein Cmr5